MLIYQKVKLK